MDIDLSEDQELFRETTARFIEARCPMAAVRARADDPLLRDPSVLRGAGELGWYALFVPEQFAGGCISGIPMRDAVIVAEERGRTVAPGPFVATNVVAFALAEAGQQHRGFGGPQERVDGRQRADIFDHGNRIVCWLLRGAQGGA